MTEVAEIHHIAHPRHEDRTMCDQPMPASQLQVRPRSKAHICDPCSARFKARRRRQAARSRRQARRSR